MAMHRTDDIIFSELLMTQFNYDCVNIVLRPQRVIVHRPNI